MTGETSHMGYTNLISKKTLNVGKCVGFLGVFTLHRRARVGCVRQIVLMTAFTIYTPDIYVSHNTALLISIQIHIKTCLWYQLITPDVTDTKDLSTMIPKKLHLILNIPYCQKC